MAAGSMYLGEVFEIGVIQVYICKGLSANKIALHSSLIILRCHNTITTITAKDQWQSQNKSPYNDGLFHFNWNPAVKQTCYRIYKNTSNLLSKIKDNRGTDKKRHIEWCFYLQLCFFSWSLLFHYPWMLGQTWTRNQVWSKTLHMAASHIYKWMDPNG